MQARYVYPELPPLVNVAAFADLVRQLPGDRRLICFWSGKSRGALPVLQRLALLRRREPELQVLAVNLDPPKEWSASTVPALRAVGAQYPCVVVLPEAVPDVLARCGVDRVEEPALLVVLDRRGNPVSRVSPALGVEELAAAVAGAMRSGQVGITTSRANCRVRMVSLGSGRLLAEFAASLPRDVLARAASGDTAKSGGEPPDEIVRLAGRIVRILPAGKALAIAPFRNAAKGAGGDAYDEAGFDLACRLSEALEGLGADVVGPEEVRAVSRRFGISLASVEFDATALGGLLKAHYILLGDFGP